MGVAGSFQNCFSLRKFEDNKVSLLNTVSGIHCVSYVVLSIGVLRHGGSRKIWIALSNRICIWIYDNASVCILYSGLGHVTTFFLHVHITPHKLFLVITDLKLTVAHKKLFQLSYSFTRTLGLYRNHRVGWLQKDEKSKLLRPLPE